MRLTSRAPRSLRATAAAALALLLATAGLTLTTGSAGATNTATIDCASPSTGNRIRWVGATDSLTVTMVNCDTYNTFGTATLSGPGSDGTVVLPAGTSADFYRGGSAVDFLSVKPLYPEHVPVEQLLVTRTADIPATALEFDAGAPNNGRSHALGGNPDCNLQAGESHSNHPYSTISIDVSVAGTYTFRGIATSPESRYLSTLATGNPISDPFLALYSSFDPANPDTGVIGCNDDLNDLFGYSDDGSMGEALSGDRVMDGHLPYFVADLTPGTYTMVLTVWDNIDGATWSSEGFGPASVTFEMWGPTGGLCVTGDPTCVATSEDPGAVTEPVAPSFTG